MKVGDSQIKTTHNQPTTDSTSNRKPKNELIKAKRRLSLIQHAQSETRNISKTCRHFGISRKTFYKWYKRYLKDPSLNTLTDRPRRPHQPARMIAGETKEQIVQLKKRTNWGVKRISNELLKLHGLRVSPWGVYKTLIRERLISPRRQADHKSHRS